MWQQLQTHGSVMADMFMFTLDFDTSTDGRMLSGENLGQFKVLNIPLTV